MIHRKSLYYILIALVLIFFQSCKETNSPDIEIPTAKRTILVYMIANNSLGSSGYDKADLMEMETAVRTTDMNNCRLLVYLSDISNSPYLFEIKNDNGNVVRKTLKNYSNKEYSTSISRMSEVMKDIQTLAPANDFGLVLWSHASGWALSLPKSYNLKSFTNEEPLPLYRNFGDDANHYMTLSELGEALPDNLFSFIYVDACYMGGIEEAYQLRNKTKYYIGSPALLPADGMPYDENIPEFIKDTPDLLQACKNTYLYYNSLTGSNKTITISLVNCNKLDELAITCKDIIPQIKNINLSEMQGYIIPSEADCIYFDFAQYMNSISSDELKAKFNDLLSQTVIYKAETPYIFGRLYIDENKYSGLSTYIPGTSNDANENYYKTLDWYKSTH